MRITHTCKVKSRNATIIEKERYKHFEDIVSCKAFHDGASDARHQLVESPYEIDCRVYQSEATLPLKRNFFGLLTIPVFIHHKAYQFIIDTGAQLSGTKESLARELKLVHTSGSVTIGSIGGTQKAMKGVIVDSLQIGAIEYHRLPILQLDDADFSMRFGRMDLLRFDGILGWDILQTMDFEIDDIKKQFLIIENHLKIPNPNMLMGSFPCFIVQLPQGEHALYGFDSGSKVSWVGEQAIQQQHYRIAGETTSIGFGVHGVEKIPTKIVEHHTLLLDKAQIDLYHTMSGRTNLFPSFSFDGVLGNEICKGRRMRMINSKGMILIA